MKNKKKKNNNKGIIIGIVIITLIIVIGIIILLINSGKNNNVTKLKIKNTASNITDYKIYTNYKDLKEDFEDSKISENDFKNNNILVVNITYDPCSEEDIKVVDYKIDGNNIKVNIEYKAVCGGCAPDSLYYALKISKDITKPKVSKEAKAINDPKCDPDVAYKPIIYLYPEEKQEVKVVLKNKNLLTTTYPKYKDNWEVVANPDGTLIDKESEREYYGLYWEGKNYTKIDMKTGFVVEGKDTIKFLEEKLKQLGLTDKEADEFIIYWLPKLENNKYNYIYFQQTEEVNEYMPLEITPQPDSLIRILMYYKPLDKKINVEEQVLKEVSRKGFTVVEWGGTKI